MKRPIRILRRALVVVSFLLPLIVRRGRRALCSTCGYDMRATPDRCPECGSITPTMAGES